MQVFRLWLPSMAHLLKAGRGALWVSRTRFNPPVFFDEGVCRVNPIVRKTIAPDKALYRAPWLQSAPASTSYLR